MIITITGNPGSGKSTIAKILLERLKAERIYVGGMFRAMAREKGVTLEEFNDYAQKHPDVDVDADKRAAQEARRLEKLGRVVLAEGRMQFHLLPESIKIYVHVDSKEGARRIWSDLQATREGIERNQKKFKSYEETLKGTLERNITDAKRFKKLYGVDITDLKQYDFVVDTTSISAVEAAGKVLKFIESRNKPKAVKKSL